MWPSKKGEVRSSGTRTSKETKGTCIRGGWKTRNCVISNSTSEEILRKSNPRNGLLSGTYSGDPRKGEFCQEIEVLKEGEEKQREENESKLSRIRTRDRGLGRRRREIERE